MRTHHPRRPSSARTTGAALSGLILLILLGLAVAGCGTDRVTVASFPVVPGARSACRTVLADLPGRVADQPRRAVEGSGYVAAWGDPAIVLRCGERVLPGKPASDPCLTRNGIGWTVPPAQIDDLGSPIDMTLSHRGLRLSVRVPASYRPMGPSEVMADLDAVVRQHTTAHGHCS